MTPRSRERVLPLTASQVCVLLLSKQNKCRVLKKLISVMVFLVGTDHPFGSNLSRVSKAVDFAYFTGFHPLANVVDSTFVSGLVLFFFCFCIFGVMTEIDTTKKTVGIKDANAPDRSNSNNYWISLCSSDEKTETFAGRRPPKGAARRKRDCTMHAQ